MKKEINKWKKEAKKWKKEAGKRLKVINDVKGDANEMWHHH